MKQALCNLNQTQFCSIEPKSIPKQLYYCEDEDVTRECPGGLSAGIGTRCYLNVEKTSWDYCSTGWIE